MNTTPIPAARPSALPLKQLRRLRWGVRGTLLLGVAASIAANILHARPNPISQAIAAWPPLALLLTVELIARIPMHRRGIAGVRIVATAIIAGIAAWVSYWHLVGVAARYGETGASPYLLPLSVDGLVVIASISLVEIASRLRPVQIGLAASRVTSTGTPVPEVALPTGAAAAPVGSVAAQVKEEQSPSEAAPDPIARVDSGHGSDQLNGGPARHSLAAAGLGCVLFPPPQPPEEPPGSSEREPPDGEQEGAAPLGDDTGEVPSDTAAAVAYWYRRAPDLHPAEIGARIGRSERTVRRYWPPPAKRPGRYAHQPSRTARAHRFGQVASMSAGNLSHEVGG